MTIEERIKRIRWCLQSIEAKHGAHESGPLRVALADAITLSNDVAAVLIELGRRVGEVRR